MSISSIFLTLVPIFFTIILGYLGGYFRVFNADSSKGLNTLVTKFALPAHLFIGITSTPKQTLIDQWPFFLTMTIGIIGFYMILLLIARFGFKYDLTKASMFSLNSTQPAFAFMGISVLGSLFGAQEVAIPIAVTGIVVNALLDPLATIVGTIGQGSSASGEEKSSTLGIILHGLSEPLACIPLAAVVLTLFGFQSPDLVKDALDQIGSVTSGVALFAVGVTVGIRKISFKAISFGISILKVVAIPLFMIAVAHMVGINHADTVKAILLVSFPGSAVAAMISTRFDSLSTETASSFVISTVLSLVSLPVYISLLM
ncbi:AEC family transporter [Domibacillus sp. DTU_2020_1001157_1_SI_ALB_TIR_016]|uniref:AEC family transporter n=1 Tax=Domibacillus sp. DTU_2020_1001157_1_SI_ALB_TIR_016 TaxID=3077789 RepID=UPI0028E946BD|nr:AEC family transporter [Domibacillus sp. DTU_2020_1001157_1_SI_ALB_TIR_016]WNS80883.1 AEC family transporter [Domibacillus sp. DTU_2020_1001157_1_SI_ALB_TIR_016]